MPQNTWALCGMCIINTCLINTEFTKERVTELYSELQGELHLGEEALRKTNEWSEMVVKPGESQCHGSQKKV